MTDILEALKELDDFQVLTSAERNELLPLLQARLGTSFETTGLIGVDEMLGARHKHSGVEFIVVPGGTFSMGLTPADIADARSLMGDQPVDHLLKHEGSSMLPPHEVQISPFLFGVDVLTLAQVELLSKGTYQQSSMRPSDVVAFRAHLAQLRLPSEAELEYVFREGRTVSFVYDAARVYRPGKPWPRVSRWGTKRLTLNAWAADTWHPSYDGAPLDGSAWAPDEPPGVFRGDLPLGPEYPEALTAALSAYRGRYRDDQENEVCVRLCADL